MFSTILTDAMIVYNCSNFGVIGRAILGGIGVVVAGRERVGRIEEELQRLGDGID